MSLNVINLPAIVKSASKVAGRNLSPRFGTAVPLTNEAFLYTEPLVGGAVNSILIQRVDLGALFKNLPQDITSYTFGETVLVETSIPFDETTEEPIIMNMHSDGTLSVNELDVHYRNWTRLVGLTALPRSQVELSMLDNDMVVEARYSATFTGVVKVKVREG